MENHAPVSHKSGRVPNLAHTQSDQPLHAGGFIVSHRVATAIGLVLTAIVAFVVTFAAASYTDLSQTVSSRGIRIIAQNPAHKRSQDILDPNSGRAIDILVVGQDSRDGDANRLIGNGSTSSTAEAGDHHADTTMILQIAANRTWANLVSIPRDSIVSVPACDTGKGTIPAQHHVMFNSIFSGGYSSNGITGAATCTMSAVKHLTGVDINQFVVVDFAGMESMINAIGGVDVCIPQDFHDPYTGLALTKGYQHLDGRNGTQFARLRHGLGDGSDIMRTARQQYLVKQLIRQIMSKNILTNANQLYQFATAAIKSLQLSEGLANINTLAGLAYSLRHFNVGNLNSRTVPTQAYPADPNRVEFAPGAQAIWKAFIDEKPLNSTGTVEQEQKEESSGSTGDSSSESSTGSGSTGASSGSQNAERPNPRTGLVTRSDGTLVDPKTNGTVDPKTGIITDPDTGYSMGIADRYLNTVVCGVPAKK